MERKIVAVNGVIGSGKDTFSKYFIDSGFHRCSFAESLKDSVAVIFGWDREMLEGSTDESRIARDVVDEYWTKELGFGIDITPRWMLQNFGTDILRAYFHDNIWLLSLENKIKKSSWDKIIITDCRFPNEIKMVRENNGTLIEVQRIIPSWYNEAKQYNLHGGDKPESLKEIHISEWGWIGLNEPQYTVHNTSTLEHLEHEATNIITRI